MTIDAHDVEDYRSLARQLAALLGDERDWLINVSQLNAFIFEQLPNLNWAGVYLLRAGQLKLGPFQGKVACTHIPLDKGVCGAAARTGEVQCVEDVHAFPGHIACDAASRSEVVVPLKTPEGELWGVLDLDSPLPARFTGADATGIALLADTFLQHTELPRLD